MSNTSVPDNISDCDLDYIANENICVYCKVDTDSHLTIA